MVLTDTSYNEIMPIFFPSHLLQSSKPNPHQPLPNKYKPHPNQNRSFYFSKNLERKRHNVHFQFSMKK